MTAAEFAAYFASSADVVELFLQVIAAGWIAGLIALAVSVAASGRS